MRGARSWGAGLRRFFVILAFYVTQKCFQQMGDNLKQRTIGAIKWSAFDRFGQQAIQFVIGLILARWFFSSFDYGQLGSIAVFSALAFILVESGFTQALIRKQDADEIDFSTVFFFNVFIAIAIYAILFAAMPLIAAYFKEPELIVLGRTLFIVIILTSLYLVPIAKLTKKMDFRSIALINLTAVLVSSVVALIMAFNGVKVWTLVVQQIVFHFVRLIGYYAVLKWIPRVIFKFQIIKGFSRFSFNLLFTSFLNVIFNNLFVFILGRKSMQEVGNYTYANKLNETTNYTFQSILNSSSYPVFAKVQNDDERFRRIYREFARKISIITFPVILTLIAIAQPLILVLLSDKWAAAIPYYQLLCASSIFATLYTLTISALNARGRSKETFQIELIKKSIILIAIAVCFQFGVLAMLGGYAFGNIVSYFISVLFLKKEIKHFIRHQITDFILPLIIGIIIAASCYVLSFIISNIYILLISQVLLAGILYLFSIKKFYPELIDKAVDYIKTILKKQ